jgi:predicted DNA-binding mobile mystery protein A
MKKDVRQQARVRLDQRLSSLKHPTQLRPPPKGWIRAIRDAIGMTGPQLAKRLGVRPQTVGDLEKAEANGTITLQRLRRAAEALECTLVYAIVPQTSLEAAVQKRAREIALRDLKRVNHTMKLEAQQTGDDDLEQRVEAYIRDRIKDRGLWSDQ